MGEKSNKPSKVRSLETEGSGMRPKTRHLTDIQEAITEIFHFRSELCIESTLDFGFRCRSPSQGQKILQHLIEMFWEYGVLSAASERLDAAINCKRKNRELNVGHEALLNINQKWPRVRIFFSTPGLRYQSRSRSLIAYTVYSKVHLQ